MHAYIALCLATGIRTEEARALRWEHVNFGDPDARPPVAASAAVWRSVRAHGDTKTEKSRRTLGLPEMAVDALRAHKKRQAGERLAAGAVLVAGALWAHAQPSAAVLAAYEADPALAVMRTDFTPTLREVLEVLIAGLLARSSR